MAEQASNATRIDVDTNHGVVYLTGIVQSSEQKSKAAELARRVDGVESVVNNLKTSER